MPPSRRQPEPTRRTTRASKPNSNSLEEYLNRSTRGSIRSRGQGASRGSSRGRSARSVSFAATPSSPHAPSSPHRDAPATLSDLPTPIPLSFSRRRMPEKGLNAQIAEARSRLARLERMEKGRSHLVGEGVEVEEMDLTGEAEEEGAYNEVINSSPPVSSPRHRRERSGMIGPPRTHGYDGQPLSREGLRREVAKRDLQREYRRRAFETPDTYDAETFMEEENVDARTNRNFDYDYIVNVAVKVYVNKASVLNDSHKGDFKRSNLEEDGLGWVENLVYESIVGKTADEDFRWEKQLITVKSLSTRCSRQLQSFQDFGEETLQHILSIADSQYFSFSTYPVSINFEVRVRCDALTEFAKPRQQRRVESPALVPEPTPPRERNDRSAQLRRINAADRRVDGYAVRATFIDELHMKWRCIDPACPNVQGFCYRDESERPGLHFKLDHPDVETWAFASERCDPGVDQTFMPPDLKTRLYRKGPIQRGNLTSAQPTPAQRLKKKQEEMEAMELELREMAQQDRLERFRERIEQQMERREAREEERQRREQEKFDAEQLRRRQEASLQSFMSPPPTYPSATAPPGYPPPPHQNMSRLPAPQQQPSSPIDEAEDEWEIVANFFKWLVARQKTVGRKAEMEHARETAEGMYWTLDDLKKMEDPHSDQYKMAVERCSIPDGLARSFKKFLKQYKGVYRQQKDDRAAGALVDMQIGGGGFVRGDIRY